MNGFHGLKLLPYAQSFLLSAFAYGCSGANYLLMADGEGIDRLLTSTAQ